MRKVTRRAALVLMMVFLLTPPSPATPDDPLAEAAEAFGRDFLRGDYEAVHARMTDPMREAVIRERAEEMRASLLENGALKDVGEAWLEAVSEEYRRYRLPVGFENAVIDLRVVFDAEHRVAGFFHVPHVEPSPDLVVRKAEAAPELLGHWEGAIRIPGVELKVLVDLSHHDGYWSGSVDIPQQGARGLSLNRIRAGEEGIEFSIADIPGDPTFKGKLEDGTIRGTFTQAAQEFPFELGRERIPPPARPQEPEPPFPYEEEEVSYTNGAIHLAGTLTLPAGDGPFPAALLISGSGPQDRNEEIFDHKPFLVLADHLTRGGIAVLRVDDRGVGGSSGSVSDSTSEDFAADALAGLKYLGTRDDIDAGKRGLVGHSEGGIVAPMVAARSEDVAFVVMLAGTGVPGDEVLRLQSERIALASGAEPEELAAILENLEKATKAIRTGADDETIREVLAELVAGQMGGEAPSEAVEQAMAEMGTPWFRFFLEYDPRPALTEVRVPVLVMNGEKDLQVAPDQNVTEIEKALAKAKNEDVTVKVLPGLNHLFQKSDTGSPNEYYDIEETFNAEALDLVRDWILERFGPAPEGAAKVD